MASSRTDFLVEREQHFNQMVASFTKVTGKMENIMAKEFCFIPMENLNLMREIG
jgi:hypothetical protein